MNNPTCATCIHWQPKERQGAYSAPCALSYGATRFDQSCAAHEAPKVDMQSQARGVWQQYYPQTKV